MTQKIRNYGLWLALLLLSAFSAAAPGASKEFTFDEKANKEIAKKLGIPVYFAVPASARAALPANINISDRLIDFKHPDAAGAQGNIGLRLIIGKRAGMTRRLAKSGLVQTGDLLLSVRPEWGGAGAYPNVQMGISHAGLAYVKDGEVRNLDNPMDAEFLGPRLDGRMTGKHYQGLKLIHIVRPRGLTDDQRARLLDWMTRLGSSAKIVYPKQISFNKDYNAPKYSSGEPVTFVTHLGRVALGQKPPGNVSMFCSEFAWSILALRDCDAKTMGDDFKNTAVPSCIKPAMTPLRATGNYVDRGRNGSYLGLADGPLMVINAMGLQQEAEDQLLRDVFVEKPGGLAKLSTGHRAVAEEMKSKFERLENYYLGISGKGWRKTKARIARAVFNTQVPENYSPTSFLINTLLPPDQSERVMDYVATIVFE